LPVFTQIIALSRAPKAIQASDVTSDTILNSGGGRL
jgi:hypothetical protein